MENKHKKVLLVGILVIIIAGLFLLICGMVQKSQVATQVTLTPEPNLSWTDTSSTIPRPVENNSIEVNVEGEWKVYKNKEYNFEFKLPKDLTVTPTSSNNNIVISKSTGGHWIYAITVEENVNQLSLDQILEQTLTEPQFKGKKVIVDDVIIGGFQAKRYQNTEFHDYGNAGVLVLVGNNIFTIFGDDSLNQYKKDFETFLKSFKLNQ